MGLDLLMLGLLAVLTAGSLLYIAGLERLP